LPGDCHGAGPVLGQLSSWLFLLLSLGKDQVQDRKAFEKAFGDSNPELQDQVLDLFIYFFEDHHILVEKRSSFCAYNASKSSAGFISKRKEAAKFASLMLQLLFLTQLRFDNSE
jgi:hypothetical protein